MTRRIRWGVIGSGGIARRRTMPEGILAAPHASLVAVHDLDAKVNADVARQFGVRAADSLAALLSDDVDAVYIASPADQHYRQALACARAGKHVLCEKPLGMTAREAATMARTFKRRGLRLGVGFMMRFSSQHQAALQLIRSGRLGQLVYGRAQLSCWYPPIRGAWRQDPRKGGGGSLMDMGGHCIDLLEMFFGDVSRVSCFTGRAVHRYASEDSATVMLQFRNGGMATVDTFFCIRDDASRNALELYGSKGGILAEGTIGQAAAGKMVAFIEKAGAGYAAQQSRAGARGEAIAPRPVNTYRAEIDEFSRAILGRRAPSNDAVHGLRSQRVIEACYRSARLGRAVTVAPSA
jgi:predicted dehydrogenase